MVLKETNSIREGTPGVTAERHSIPDTHDRGSILVCSSGRARFLPFTDPTALIALPLDCLLFPRAQGPRPEHKRRRCAVLCQYSGSVPRRPDDKRCEYPSYHSRAFGVTWTRLPGARPPTRENRKGAELSDSEIKSESLCVDPCLVFLSFALLCKEDAIPRMINFRLLGSCFLPGGPGAQA